MPANIWAELCFKCQRPGHVARDCPGATGTPAWPGAEEGAIDRPAVCLRCGRPDCAAAGQGDFVRCALPGVNSTFSAMLQGKSIVPPCGVQWVCTVSMSVCSWAVSSNFE